MATNLRNVGHAVSVALIANPAAPATANERDTRGPFAYQHVSETVASHGLVTGTTGAAASEAGLRMLKTGGTAAYAVVATAITQVCVAAGFRGQLCRTDQRHLLRSRIPPDSIHRCRAPPANFGMTPQEAIHAPAFGSKSFDESSADLRRRRASDKLKTQLEATGMTVQQNDSMRGY